MQFFTQSNPLNNLNITSSIPPILQRQNSAPSAQQNQQQQQQHQQNQLNGDNFYKPNNINKPPVVQSTSNEIQRKYSLPMSSTTAMPSITQATPSSALHQHQFQQSTILRKQSAPSMASTQVQFQFQDVQPAIIHGSPNRARDRNLFDKMPSSQDVQQLQLLKGAIAHLHVCFLAIFSFFLFS